MIAPPPTAAVIQCVKPADAASTKIKSRMVVGGSEATVQTWLDDAAKKGMTIIETDRRALRRRDVSVVLPDNTAYHTIGALIYSGQASAFSVTMNTEPPICRAEAK